MLDEDRWPFVRTGPGTLAGRYLRRFWQPIYESRKLSAGQAVQVRILGEDFTLYRGESGAPHLVGHRCPHRLTVLSTGRVEGDSIRCYYHGWRFDHDGRCLEQPAEPRPFCEKVRVAAYPACEQLGLVFVFLGEGEPPPLPAWPEFEADSVTSIALLPCNYFQSAENILDDVHVAFTHRSLGELSSSSRGDEHPRVEAVETAFGMTVSFHTAAKTERNHWLMPNSCSVGYDLRYPRKNRDDLRFRARTLFWYVPVDDQSHLHVMVTAPGAPFLCGQMRAELDTPHSVAQQIMDVLEGRSRAHRGGGNGQPKLPNLVRTQDGVAVVGQGSIVDRSQEHLGASDAGVVLLRRIWRRELRRLSQGEPLTLYARPADLVGLLSSASCDPTGQSIL
jgi:5,5'-dehydrodivanillate O-demethylase